METRGSEGGGSGGRGAERERRRREEGREEGDEKRFLLRSGSQSLGPVMPEGGNPRIG